MARPAPLIAALLLAGAVLASPARAETIRLGDDTHVHLRTMDVLHSFWLPHVRLKQDLLPGQTIRQWFEATKTGTYSVVCAELCGTAHTKMGGRLIVESQQEFDAWIAKKAEQGMDPFASKYWKTWKESSKQ